MSISSHLQIVPSKSPAYYQQPEPVLLSSRSRLQVPWFARAVYTEEGRPVYTEEEVEMYPLEPLDLKMKPYHHTTADESENAYSGRHAATEEEEGLDAVQDLSGGRLKSAEDGLPSDPRLWSREEVCRWVLWTCSLHNLPAPNTDRFLMNGKAVCLMSLNMFISRVPLGGKLLYRDFQIRLGRALYR
jgi:ETS-domain lacking